MRIREGAVVALALTSLTLLAACSPTSEPAVSDPPASSDPSQQPTDEPTDQPTTTPTPTTTPVTMPTDCKAILSKDVLAQLADIPLNDPAFGETGSRPDGSLLCAWGDPAADTTGLTTTITKVSRGLALDQLNKLADEEDFTCYTPNDGVRCENSWQNEMYPVTDGRTLFWRDGVMSDTQYSNLAPTGYTDSIIAALWG